MGIDKTTGPSNEASSPVLAGVAEIGLGASLVGLGQHLARTVKLPMIDKTAVEVAIGAYRNLLAGFVARDNRVTQDIAIRFVEFVHYAGRHPLARFNGWISPAQMMQMARDNMSSFNLGVRAARTTTGLDFGGTALQDVYRQLAVHLRLITSNTAVNRFLGQSRELGAGAVATGVGALAYLKTLGGTVVAATTGGTVAVVGAAATTAAGVGLGWHYSGLGEVTGTDELGYSVGEWAYELLNPSYDSDYLHSITAPAE